MRCIIDVQESFAPPRRHGVCDVFGTMPITFHISRHHFLTPALAIALFGLTLFAGTNSANALEIHIIFASEIGPAERLRRALPNRARRPYLPGRLAA
jgi:hypothetical protein